MDDYPYTMNTGRLRTLMGLISEVGVPKKLTVSWLESAGYKSKNDRPILSVLRFIGFIDQEGVPTRAYREYRDASKRAAVLAAAVKGAYSGLFGMYADAQTRDAGSLQNYFSTHTSQGAVARSAIVSTFQTLCSLADFEAELEMTDTPREPVDAPAAGGESPRRDRFPFQTLAVNIQLVLPETTNFAVYERIFEAMRKHLLGAHE